MEHIQEEVRSQNSEDVEFQTILNGITDPIVHIGSDFGIRRVNLSTVTYSNKQSFQEVVGTKCYETLYGRNEVCPYCPLKNSNIDSVFDSSKQNNKSISREILNRTQNKTRILYLNFFPILTEIGISSFVETISDLTEIKEKEEENLRIRNLASLGIMVSGIAHELNNPLTGIGLTLQNLLSNFKVSPPDIIEKRLEMMRSDLKRASEIVADIISFAKTTKVKTASGDITEAILKAKDSITRIYPVLSARIVWEFDLDSNLIFPFNPVKLERLFQNLFRNAIQAFDYNSGYIKVETKKKKDKVIITIEDNAGGIPETIVAKIFDPFFTNSKSGDGVGLGLSICSSIVNEHCGSITVKTSDGKTRFTITLPFS